VPVGGDGGAGGVPEGGAGGVPVGGEGGAGGVPVGGEGGVPVGGEGGAGAVPLGGAGGAGRSVETAAGAATARLARPRKRRVLNCMFAGACGLCFVVTGVCERLSWRGEKFSLRTRQRRYLSLSVLYGEQAHVPLVCSLLLFPENSKGTHSKVDR
jgi:hypothetical protein